MQQVQLPLDVNGNAHVAYVQSRSIGGQGDDVSVLDPSIRPVQFCLWADSVPLCRSRLFHTLPFGYSSPEIFQRFVEFRMRTHIRERQFLFEGAVGSRYIFEQALADCIVDPVGYIVQAGGVSVYFPSR